MNDYGPSAAEALLALLERLKEQPVLLERDVLEIAAELGVELEPPAPNPLLLAREHPSMTWRAHGSPAAAVWWGFLEPEDDPGFELLGTACTLVRHGKELSVSFPGGREIWFAVHRQIRLGVAE